MEYATAALVIAVGLWVSSKIASTVVGILPASLTGNATFGSWITLLVQAGIVLGVVLIARKALPRHVVEEL